MRRSATNCTSGWHCTVHDAFPRTASLAPHDKPWSARQLHHTNFLDGTLKHRATAPSRAWNPGQPDVSLPHCLPYPLLLTRRAVGAKSAFPSFREEPAGPASPGRSCFPMCGGERVRCHL